LVVLFALWRRRIEPITLIPVAVFTLALGLDEEERRRLLTALTAIAGVTGTVDAAAQIALALTVSTATFGVVARIAGYAIIGSGLAAGAVYVRWIRGRARRARPQPEP
jgi:hypothetical protein